MKYRVIGWTSYDVTPLDEGEDSWAAHMAIVDDIKRNDYLFGGKDHQDRSDCAPVLNDGKIRRYSQRGFGGLMAEARGQEDTMAYAKYMFSFGRDCRLPKNVLYFSDEVPVEENLEETFTMTVDEESFAMAAQNGKVKFADLLALRYIDAGDTLILQCGDKEATYPVVDVDRKIDVEERKRQKLLLDAMSGEESCRARARQEMDAAPIALWVTLKNK